MTPSIELSFLRSSVSTVRRRKTSAMCDTPPRWEGGRLTGHTDGANQTLEEGVEMTVSL